MSTSDSKALDEHFKKGQTKVSHLEYMDKILGNIHPTHIEKVLEMRQTIELTLLDNPESKSEVVAYLSGIGDRLQKISNTGLQRLKQESEAITSI